MHFSGLFPRMMLQDRGLPGGGVDVGVDFGGEDGFVTEHLVLNAAKNLSPAFLPPGPLFRDAKSFKTDLIFASSCNCGLVSICFGKYFR